MSLGCVSAPSSARRLVKRGYVRSLKTMKPMSTGKGPVDAWTGTVLT